MFFCRPKMFIASVTLFFGIFTINAHENNYKTNNRNFASTIGNCAINAALTPIYPYIAYKILKASVLLRNESYWKDSILFPYTEADRLNSCWAIEIWPTAEALLYAASYDHIALHQAIDAASRGVWKSKYTGERYNLARFVHDLDFELNRLNDSRRYVVLASKYCRGMRSRAQRILEQIELISTRGLALKTIIIKRPDYQYQVQDMHCHAPQSVHHVVMR